MDKLVCSVSTCGKEVQEEWIEIRKVRRVYSAWMFFADVQSEVVQVFCLKCWEKARQKEEKGNVAKV